MSTSTVGSGDRSRGRKHDRQDAVHPFWVRPTPHEMDVLDGGDHFKVTSCDSDVVGWWLGTLRAAYPQDHISGDGSVLKMHPEAGVTLQLNKDDGTLKIKGKKHFKWFKENFDALLSAGGDVEKEGASEMSKVCDRYLRIDDAFTVSSSYSTHNMLV